MDVYKGELTARKSPLDVLLFISFFPHLVAGPIVRASEFIPQLEKPPSSDIDGNRAILLIASGLFKKLVIANYLAIDLVDPVFESVGKFGGLNSWLAIYGYAMQIYCDFSAYSDMAIGFAALLGYRFPENFNQPYRAHSLQDFWRRWHISLSSWLRDYLYVPLGGSKNGKYKRYRNLFLTMFIGGIWHGASWTFVFWGSLHGGFLALERWYYEKNGESCACAPSRFWQRFVVFNFVCFSWIFFRCESLSKALDFILSLFDFSQKLKVVTPFNVLLVVIGGLLHFLPTSGYDALTVRMARFPTPILGVLCGLLLMILASLTPDEVAPFIYFRF